MSIASGSNTDPKLRQERHVYSLRLQHTPQAPLGVSIRHANQPIYPIRLDDMPLLTELAETVVGSDCYKHAAPDGAFAMEQFLGAPGLADPITHNRAREGVADFRVKIPRHFDAICA